MQECLACETSCDGRGEGGVQGGRLINMNGSFMGQTLKWEESLVKSDDELSSVAKKHFPATI